MEVKFSPELQAKLERVAQNEGREPESLVHEAVERLLSYDDWFVREVEKGQAQAEKGDLLEHDDVVRRVEALIHSKQKRD